MANFLKVRDWNKCHTKAIGTKGKGVNNIKIIMKNLENN
jgi:hypothetical protein